MNPIHTARMIAVLICILTARSEAQSVPVVVVVPQIATAEQIIELTGSFDARRRASLSPRTSGLVSRVMVDAGDRVDVGDVLLQLDAQLAELAVAEAEAALGQSQAAYDEVVRLREEGIRLARDKHLPETEVQARVSAAALAAAALKQAESVLATVQERVARHRVLAPFAGTIVRKLTEAGEWVQTGSPVLELVDTNEIWLDVRVPQERWPALNSNAQITIQADALPLQSFTGRLHARVPVNDLSSRTFLARLTVDELPDEITPGMSAKVRFVLGNGEKVLKLPRDALIRYPDGTATVWIVDDSGDGNTAREREVRLGRVSGDEIEILAGLDARQPVITRGNEVLVEGQSVHIRDPL
jgi:RND family efflux transporter MFP subunit